MLPQYGCVMLASDGRALKVKGSVPPATPMAITAPPGATTLASSASVASLPTQSSTSAAPRPPASSRISAAAVSPDATVCVAPSSRASSSLAASMSVAITRAGESARSSCTAMWPRPPTPITTALLPGTSFGSASLIA